MQIDKELLSEKNYTGSRLIPITDANVAKLKKELVKFQKQANPFLKKMETLSKDLDPYYKQISELEEQKKKLQEQIRPTRELYEVEHSKVKLIDQKAQLIKDKMNPLVLKFLEGKLGEFEEAKQLVEKNGVIYAEVFDKIETYIQGLRTYKNKK